MDYNWTILFRILKFMLFLQFMLFKLQEPKFAAKHQNTYDDLQGDITRWIHRNPQ